MYIKETQELTGRKSSLIDDPFESVIDQLAIHKEPQVSIDGGVPLSDGPFLRLLHFLLTLLSLLFGVQLHRHKPHLLHKPLRLTGVPLLRLLRRGRRNRHRTGLQGHSRNFATEAERAGTSAEKRGIGIESESVRGCLELELEFGEIVRD